MELSYDKLYDNWLASETHLTLPINKKNYIGKIYIGDAFDLSSFDLLNQIQDKSTAFFHVEFSYPYFHIAILLYRAYHPEICSPTLELIDSMPRAGYKLQLVFENCLREKCIILDVEYSGTHHMYNGMKSIENTSSKYNWMPPLCLSNLLTHNPHREDFDEYVSSIGEYGAVPMSDHNKSRNYICKLKSFTGGDCILWTYRIASDLVTQNISSRQWMINFKAYVEQSPEAVTWYSINYLIDNLDT